jgi:hypothetical protein
VAGIDIENIDVPDLASPWPATVSTSPRSPPRSTRTPHRRLPANTVEANLAGQPPEVQQQARRIIDAARSTTCYTWPAARER